MEDSKTIEVRGVQVTCYADGSVEKIDGRTGKLVRTMGFDQSSGYLSTSIKGLVLVHRLIAMAFIENFDTDKQVDHVDGNKKNNALSNLRELSQAENKRAKARKREGTSSRYRGISWIKRENKWKASMRVRGKYKHIGYFDCEHEAAIAWNKAATEAGYFPEAMNVIEYDLELEADKWDALTYEQKYGIKENQ
jgi:hypothetical protein